MSKKQGFKLVIKTGTDTEEEREKEKEMEGGAEEKMEKTPQGKSVHICRRTKWEEQHKFQ